MLDTHSAESVRSNRFPRPTLVASGVSAVLLAAMLFAATIPAAAAPDPPQLHASPSPTQCPQICGLPNPR